MKTVLVCGGRRFGDWELLVRVLDSTSPACIVTGDSKGADELTVWYSLMRKLPYKVYKADWESLGRSAGPIRNLKMLLDSKADLVVAFEGGRGTDDCVYKARGLGIPVWEVKNEKFIKE